MEHAVIAPADGKIAALHFQSGDMVNEDVELLVLDMLAKTECTG